MLVLEYVPYQKYGNLFVDFWLMWSAIISRPQIRFEDELWKYQIIYKIILYLIAH